MPTPLGSSLSFSSNLTGIKALDSLLSGSYWAGTNWTTNGPTNLSYSFIEPNTSYFATNYSADNEYNAIYALSGDQKNGIINALATWSAVANINFTQTTDNISNVGDLRFGGYALMGDQAAAWAYNPSNSPVGGDVWIGEPANEYPTKGTYDFMTYIHEIGHALGFKHPFSASSGNSTILDPALDDVRFTVMSYNNNYSYQPTTPMVLDILAMQALYGANTHWQTGDNVYSWKAYQPVFETIWDAGGNDTIDASTQAIRVDINLNEGAYSTIGLPILTGGSTFNSGLAIAYGAKIENAIGSNFNDVLRGNDLDNVLNGGTGADSMYGGAGNDTYYVDNRDDRIFETGTSTSEIDSVFSTATYNLLYNQNVENLTLQTSANINGYGNALSNVITGNAGNNILDGDEGADRLIGGAGNDTYVVDNFGDVIVETSTVVGEIDTVRTSVSWTLGDNLENLELSGGANINAVGNAQDNILTGNAGSNVLDGQGGLDTLIGGAGNDAYVIDQAAELNLAKENANEGSDTLLLNYSVQSNTLVDLNSGTLSNFENVTLNGAGAFDVLGNGQDNILIGNTFANNLQGGAGNDMLDGGDGVDTLIGGTGNDTYVINSLDDTLVEQANEGRDLVRTSVSYTLGANIEDGELLGSSALNLNGNELANVLIGNSGDNFLDGGLGADQLIGGDGNDTYLVDNTSDVIVEGWFNDYDHVYASASFTLDINLEALTLTGAGNINATGNYSANNINGNLGNNILDGGAGADTLSGLAGDDIYVVDDINDRVIEAANEGRDQVRSSISYTLSANVEDGVLLGNAAINLDGNNLDNVLSGNSGDNTLNGSYGADIMIGGDGIDTYCVDNVGDVVIETDTSPTAYDRVFASIDYTLGANVENLILVGSANLNGTGSNVANRITGNDGANILDGGLGADQLIGGLGNDTYIVDNLGDSINETSALVGETDTVRSSVSWTLGANLENLFLTGGDNLNGVGNSQNNFLIGNNGNNVLSGGAGDDTLDGGVGADAMVGGDGVDTYYVDNIGDLVIETDTSPTAYDRVFSSIDYTLGANVENLLFLGSANLNGTGSNVANRITGNAGDNILDGGLGADQLIGGLGNDTYIVDNLGDSINETSTLAGEIDTVRSSVDWTLGANLENLVMTGSAVNGTGNELNNSLTGNDGDNTLNGGLGADIMIGGAGIDTYYVDNIGDVVIETDASPTAYDRVFSSIDYTLGANVENLLFLGSANLNGTGSNVANRITGNAGDNILDGGLGADQLIGGLGNDTYIIDNLGDTINETSTLLGETDTVRSSVSWTLGANLENLFLTGNDHLNGVGNSQNNFLIGNNGNNVLSGGAGDDTLDGGVGADAMVGGDGVDTYYVDNIGDLVIETDTSPTAYDRVFSSIDYTLGANVENLLFLGSANLNGTGSNVANRITGNAGDNILDGGLGADQLIGGLGNDTYIVDNLGDSINETSTLAGEIDTVRSSVDWTLGANLENLVLTGSAVNGTGNELNNSLTGNGGDNTLNGGSGADIMIGGAGLDTYYVDNLGDVVIETETSPTAVDRVFSSVDYTLGANVENLTLTGNAVYGIGNASINRITGNDGDNTLDGGLGADIMIGGAGIDTYYVDNIGDLVIETDTSPTAYDRVFSSIDYTLGANVENLLFLGSANLNGTGSNVVNRITGNAGDNILDGGLGADQLIGGLGNDTYIVDNLGDSINETSTLAGEIDTVRSSVDWTLGANLENLVLTGSAVNGTGNELNNSLTGNDGDNTLNGGLGADIMIGGAGIDTYYVDNIGDVVIETDASPTAYDRVFSSIDYALGANVENLLFVGSANLNGTGSNVANRITGNAGDNILDGGLGADQLIGGLGNDTYIVDNLGDTINETSTLLGETDTVRSSVSWTLGANLENLFLTGNDHLNGVGNSQNNFLIGNNGNNVLSGGAGDDTLDGGVGADAMVGGDGVDTYYVDNIGDLVIETDTSPTAYDRVFASIDYTLGANVENLLLLGSANLNGTGNNVANQMTGNAGNNILDGGLGADQLIGGLGNDTYVVDNVGDTISETSTLAGEIDTVRSSIDWTLGDNLENLVLTGSANLRGTGNSLNNVLIGGTGNDSLTGGAGDDTLDGGVGADFMRGGDGADTYYVDDDFDFVFETGSSLTEHDQVFASIDYNMEGNIEDMQLLGTANLNGTGNDIANRMTGNAGNNTFDGGLGNDTLIGGLGKDTLTGGSGADTFVFNTWNETGVGSLRDVITDFSSIEGDKINLSQFDANLLNAGIDGFNFIGASDFTGAGQLRFVDHVLSGNVSGNAGADFEIQLVGVNTFSASDLVA
ncbi:M10 family metallopeptidase C-terminal domain-containing protein [Pseudomonas sp. B21-053]|uniref:M10 family metallopeptidase C-terminal domain-containing protein n=1 Tax=Pseudomonas sp. B21-053 TaxID=2895493 RepID=UPI0029FF278C|nr:M10 family metallopeptidase C-terminal domain-containing protein [Pseudomonas sp. B21-053]